MHTIIIQCHILSRQMAIPAGMPVRPQEHSLRRIKNPKFEPSFSPFPFGDPEFLHLDHVELQVMAVQLRLVASEGLRPEAISALIPQPVLEMRGREGPQNGGSFEILEAVDGLEGRPEGLSVAVVHSEIGDVLEEAVMAADDAAVLVEDHGAEEPVAAGDDDVVEFVDLSGPFLVVLVQVEVEEAGFGGAVGVSHGGFDEMRRPENGHGEVVARVFPSLEILIRCVRHIYRIFHL